MARVNLMALPMVQPPTERFTFTDPDHPDEPLDIPFGQLDGPLWFHVQRRANAMVVQYITGSDGRQPMDFPPLGSPPQSIPRNHLSPELFFAVAQAEIMNEIAEPNEQERYSAENFVAMSRAMLHAWPALLMFLAHLNDQSTHPKGRAPTEQGPPQQEPPQQEPPQQEPPQQEIPDTPESPAAV